MAYTQECNKDLFEKMYLQIFMLVKMTQSLEASNINLLKLYFLSKNL